MRAEELRNQALGDRYFSGTNQYSLVNMHWWNDTQVRFRVWCALHACGR